MRSLDNLKFTDKDMNELTSSRQGILNKKIKSFALYVVNHTRLHKKPDI